MYFRCGFFLNLSCAFERGDGVGEREKREIGSKPPPPTTLDFITVLYYNKCMNF